MAFDITKGIQWRPCNGRPLILLITTALILASTVNALAQVRSRAASNKMLAPTPPMGWNSWDAYGTTVREDEVRANADYMAQNLARYGWKYVVVDIEWYSPKVKSHGYIPNPDNVSLDKFGRLVPASDRFPSAASGVGFKALADYVHSRGLRFGIHIMRGIPRRAVEENLPIMGTPYHARDIADKVHVCTWQGMEDMYGVDMSKPGAQAYYDSIAALYASWGVDFIKADDMTHPYHEAEIRALSRAIESTGRPIVLSLSPGPAPLNKIEDLRSNAEMWRISSDIWDQWSDLRRQFDLTSAWQEYVRPGSWPDADMLPLGRIGIRSDDGSGRYSALTHDEQLTLITLWCIFRSPLMFGGDLPSNDSFTSSLITNSEVLAVDQNSAVNHQSYRIRNTIAWTADIPGKTTKYLAIFNVGGSSETLELNWRDVGIHTTRALVRDLWSHKDLGSADHVAVRLRSHSSVLYKVAPE